MKLKSKANMDIDQISPIDHVSRIRVPAIFISGTLDTLVPHEQTSELYKVYQGPK